MKMKKRGAVRQASDLGYLTRFMSGLHEDQSKLREIQSVYDNLTLLGQLLCAGTDITGMRKDFNDLAALLLDQLAHELRKKAVLSLGSNARVAIDILIRNLFERTADIGFLATDSDICAFAEAVEAHPATARDAEQLAAMHARFSEYVRKYSVYHNIILLSPEGQVLVQLDQRNPVKQSHDALIAESLNTEQAYVETFRHSDLLPGEASPLIYSYRVMSADGSHPVGVLCLCFRFQDECQRIFDSLVSEDDWSVVTILSPDGHVIASSDIYQFPLGAKLEKAEGEACRIVRFAGREYLATTRATHGYQGYQGPGWLGHVLAPLNHAFEMAIAHELEQVDGQTLEGVLETATLFPPELRNIPLRAASIQRELNRTVWNGNIWLSRDNYAMNTSFAKVLLWEIGSTGVRTRNVFSQSTTNLYETVVSSVLYDCSSQAALAMDIMDRNLYERANDCRWWALTSAFREALSRPALDDGQQRKQLTEILRTINRLYTVYDNLLIFDTSARIVAVSNPAYTGLIGQTLQTDWVRQTLSLSDSQRYGVSSYAPTPLYGGQATYIYSAAIHASAGNEPVGGIAIVFDAAPQFEAMLQDALPRKEDGTVVDGAIAIFAERDGTVIASSDAALRPGDKLGIDRKFFELASGEGCANIVEYRQRYYAVGSRMSSGYREYKDDNDAYRNEVVALVLVPLSERVLAAEERQALRHMSADSYAKRQVTTEEAVEIATFYIGGGWYGVRADHIVEAIEGCSITPIPGLPSWVRGCVMHQDQPITVFDLASFLPGYSQPSSSSQIVVVNVPEQGRFGILVDDLGEIPEIPTARIESVSSMLSVGGSLTESLVKPQQGNDDHRILVILSTHRIMHRLSGLPELGMDSAPPVQSKIARLPSVRG
jgi:chemotaxis signal transduction protein